MESEPGGGFVQSKCVAIWIVVCSLMFVGCAPASSPPVSDASVPEMARAGPGRRGDMLAPPLPSPTAVLPGATAISSDAGSARTQFPLSAIPATTTVATPLGPSGIGPSWTGYENINTIFALAFGADGTLWAATSGGLVHWDLGSERYTRYPFDGFVGDLAVAADGSLWLATEYGLCHFDGTACQVYTEAEGLIDNAIRTVVVDPDGVVWVGTPRGVGRFDGEAWRSYPSEVPTNDLAAGTAGEVWAATSGGIGRYLPAEDSWVTYGEEHGLPSPGAQVIATSPGGEVWAYLLWEGVYRFDGDLWRPVEGIEGLVAVMAFDAEGRPWIANSGGTHYPGGFLVHREGERWIDVTKERGLISIDPVAIGPRGEVAAGTSLGLGIYQDGAWHLLRDGPARDHPSSVAVTPDGAAWFGFGDHSVSTTGGGVSRLDGQRWQYFLGDAEVNVLEIAPDGSLWAAEGCALWRFEGADFEMVADCGEGRAATGNILDFGFAPDGAVWAATGFALARFDGRSWTVYEKLVNSVEIGPEGAVWVNGWEGRQDSQFVGRFDGETWTTFPISGAFPGSFWVQAVTPDGLLWGTGPEGGLVAFDGASWDKPGAWNEPGAWSLHGPPSDLEPQQYRAITVAPDGSLWMSAEEAVVHYDRNAPVGEAWTAYSVESSDPAMWPSGSPTLAPDGTVWVGTTHLQPAQ
jgi:ligand-binding sensor domain-containing protein